MGQIDSTACGGSAVMRRGVEGSLHGCEAWGVPSGIEAPQPGAGNPPGRSGLAGRLVSAFGALMVAFGGYLIAFAPNDASDWSVAWCVIPGIVVLAAGGLFNLLAKAPPAPVQSFEPCADWRERILPMAVIGEKAEGRPLPRGVVGVPGRSKM